MARAQSSEEGTSLVGLLVTLVVLAALASLAFAALRGEEGPSLPSSLDAATGPSGPAPISGPTGAAAAASIASCRAAVATLESAMVTAHAVRGTYPTSLQELQDAGFLSDLPDSPGFTFVPEAVDGQPTGRILVNGQRAETGCR